MHPILWSVDAKKLNRCRGGTRNVKNVTRFEERNDEDLTTKSNAPTPELLHKMNAYWRAANHLSAGQIHLYDDPLLKK